MADKRFWSGAIIVVTVAVSGAGALPGLLLRNDAPEAALIEVAAIAARPADPKPVAVTPPPAPVALPAPEAVAPTPVPPVPEASRVSPPSEPPRVAAKPEPFPPVQPADVVAGPKTEPEATPAPALVPAPVPSRRLARVKPAWHKHAARLAWAKKTRVARAEMRVKRSARPAAYPIREFLAWRR